MTGCSCGAGLCTDCARDMRRAILNVRQLHRAVKSGPKAIEVCNACSSLRDLLHREKTGVAYPCATVRVLDDAGV